MIKILFTQHRDVYSGAEQVLINILPTIVISGEFQVHAFVPTGSELKQKLEKIPYVHIHGCKLSAKSDFCGPFALIRYFLESIKANISLLKIIFIKKIDIVHHNHFCSATRFLPSKILFPFVKHVWTHHDIFLGKKNSFAKLLTKYYDGSIFVSEPTRQSCISKINNLKYIQRIPVIGNSVEIRTDKNFDAADKLYSPINYLCVGMLTEWKGQLRLLESWVPDPKKEHLYFIGGGNDEKYKERLQIASIKNKNVHVLGYLKSPFSNFNHNNTFSILCSISPDPLPTVVLESISMGIIPIVTCYGGAYEMICPQYRNRLVFDPLSVNSTQTAISFLRNLTIQKKNIIRTDLYEYILKNFSHKNKYEKLKKFYNHVAHL